MKKDYNKPKKIHRNYDNIAELKAAQEQSLEKIKYTENKLERLWKLVSNIEIINERDNTELIYSGYMSYTNIAIGDPVSGYNVQVHPTAVEIPDFNLNKTFFSYSLSASTSLVDLSFVGWIQSGEYIVEAETNQPIPVLFSGTIYIRIFATIFV